MSYTTQLAMMNDLKCHFTRGKRLGTLKTSIRRGPDDFLTNICNLVGHKPENFEARNDGRVIWEKKICSRCQAIIETHL